MATASHADYTADSACVGHRLTTLWRVAGNTLIGRSGRFARWTLPVAVTRRELFARQDCRVAAM